MNNYVHPLHHHFPKDAIIKKAPKANTSFKQVLSSVSEVKLSNHAKSRLHERNIYISNEKWNQISEKMNEAKGKGVTDALVVLEDVALVVNTKNNIVVTAVDSKTATDKIFTNINGTILI